jgi:hypothetical protein
VTVLSSVVSALGDRLDSKFLTAYWLPAFVAVLGGFGLLVAGVGVPQLEGWVAELDSVEQSLSALIAVLLITMLAFILRALALPIAALFTGSALPKAIAAWSIRGQIRARNRAAQFLATSPSPADPGPSALRATEVLDRAYPQDTAETKPTRLGNVLAAAAEHPRLAYAMDGGLWWPRLMPLLPTTFLSTLGGAQAPTMALLNLSAVFCALALGAAIILVLAAAQWVTALVILVAGLLLAHLCYQAAVSQARELGSLIRVGFDLYRSDILTQLQQDPPSDLAAERALWQRLTAEVLGLPDVVRTGSEQHNAPADPPPAGHGTH